MKILVTQHEGFGCRGGSSGASPRVLFNFMDRVTGFKELVPIGDWHWWRVNPAKNSVEERIRYCLVEVTEGMKVGEQPIDMSWARWHNHQALQRNLEYVINEAEYNIQYFNIPYRDAEGKISPGWPEVAHACWLMVQLYAELLEL